MNLNEKIVAIELELTPEQITAMNKPIRGSGGFQNFMRKLQEQSTYKVVLKLDLSDVEKAKRYATKYGNGGFQGRLLKLLQKNAAKIVTLESQ